MTTVAVPSTALPTTVAEALDRVRALRPTLDALGPAIDVDGVDAGEAMGLLAGTGAQAMNVPVEYGGLLRAGAWSDYDTYLEAFLEVAAADGSVGQMWGFSGVFVRSVLTDPELPEPVRSRLAHEVLHEGLRMGIAMSERGTAGPVVSRRADGGIVVDGTKAFATNSGAGGRTVMGVPHLHDGAPHLALVRMDADGVEPAHDWDTMGQRGTDSQTLRLREVFVPDGWHHPDPGPGPEFLVAAMTGGAALLVGIGEGALAATLEHLRGMDRASMPMFASPASDPVMHRVLGEMSSRLAAPRALVLDVGRALAAGTADPALMVRSLQADQVAARTAVAVSSDLFDLTGARSTAGARRLDRFWRNARTMATHHSREATATLVGSYLMNGALPTITDYIRM